MCTAQTRAFTLIEMISVLVLVSVLSVTAIPAIARLDRAQDAAMLREVERQLRLAQTAAVATGMPAGIEFNLDTQTIQLLQLNPETLVQVPLGRLGSGSDPALHLPQAFASASIAALSVHGVALSTGIHRLWFAPDGTPHTREDSGSDPQPISQALIVRSARDDEVRVLPWTGQVTR